MKKRASINIGDRKVGDGYPCFIVAEVGVNHNGSLKLAKKLTTAAKKAGANAVKFQIFIPEEIVSPNAAKADYQKETTGKGSQYEMLKKLSLSEMQFKILRDFARNEEIIFFATAHDLASIDIFDRLNLPIIKVASPDLNNALLFLKIARSPTLRKKPLFLSTGASTLKEVRESIDFLKENGFVGPILLYQCVSAYPAPPADQNLKVMQKYRKIFDGIPVGFSDNTGDVDILKAAVYSGAVSVETNITLDRNMEGPDHRISNNPSEFAMIIREIRAIEKNPILFKSMLGNPKIEKAMGDGNKRVMKSEISTMLLTRKSIVAAGDLPNGTSLTVEMLSARRPMGGLSPMEYRKLISKRLVRPVRKGDQLTLADVKS